MASVAGLVDELNQQVAFRYYTFDPLWAPGFRGILSASFANWVNREGGMRILLVDDHRLFLEGMSRALDAVLTQPEIRLAESVQRGIDILEGGWQVQLILADLSFPGMDGIALLDALHARRIRVPVVMVSATEARSEIRRAMQAGAAGYLPKSNNLSGMRDCIQRVMSGRRYLPEAYADCEYPGVSPGTEPSGDAEGSVGERQLAVLRLVAEGYSNKQIASVLDITEATVKYHIRILFTALGARRRTAVVQEARRREWL